MDHVTNTFSLHYPVVAPSPSGTDIEFFDAAGSGIGVMECLRVKNNSQFAEEFFEGRTAVGQPGKFDRVAIHIPHDGFLTIDNDLSQRAELSDFAAEKLNEFAGIVDRAGVND